MKQNITSLICLIAFALTTNAQTEKFLAGGISFEGPKGWQSQKPSSSMRKALSSFYRRFSCNYICT